MYTPIPAPKVFNVTEKTVPAVLPSSLDATRWDPEFDGAVASYRHALRRYEDAPASPVTLERKGSEGTDYSIRITPEGVTLTAPDNGAMNRALSTLFQLTEKTDEGYVLPCGEISDRSDSSWRGLMLDLARCWHEPEYLYAAADLCWLYKLNRLQLHLNDDQAVRFPFRSYPEAVTEEHYTEETLKDFIAYCTQRGILLIPEIDAPGHATAFTKAYPEIFGTTRGLMCAEEKTFAALEKIYGEIAEFFPDSPYIHVGGDEAAIAKWKDCPQCEAYRTAHNLADEHQLYGHYILRLTEIVKKLGRTPMVWEGFAKECNGMIPKDVLIFAWESYYQLPPELLEGGFTVINASWKPLYVVPRKRMWEPEEILDWEPNRWENFWEASIASKAPIIVDKNSPILGGQMCVWGDNMQPAHAFAPRHDMIREEFDSLSHRLPALAEKVWNPYTSPDKAIFLQRLAAAKEKMKDLL